MIIRISCFVSPVLGAVGGVGRPRAETKGRDKTWDKVPHVGIFICLSTISGQADSNGLCT